MSFQEKSAWLSIAITVVVFGAYYAIVLGHLPNTPIAEIAYELPLVAAIVAGIVLSIITHIAIAIPAPREAGTSDERDTTINWYGEFIGSQPLWVGALAALILALTKSEPFWIANVLFATFFAAGLISSAAKIVAYRRGFEPW